MIKSKLFMFFTAAFFAFATPSFGQGVPTIDVASLAQMSEQAVRDIQHYASVLDNMKSQIQTAQNQLQSVTGIRNIANLSNELNNITKSAGTLKDIFNNPNRYLENGLNALPNQAQALMKQYGVSDLCKKFDDDTVLKNICEADLTSKIATTYQNNVLIERLDENLKRLAELAEKANNSTDLKTSVDISNQIAIVSANIQAIQYSLNTGSKQLENFESMVTARKDIELDRRSTLPVGLTPDLSFGNNTSNSEQW